MTARRRAGLRPGDALAALGNRVSVVQIEAHERGELWLDDQDVRILVSLYGLQLDALVPQRVRLVIDREEGMIGIGTARHPISPTMGDDEILIRYLALVYLLRDVKPGRFFVPRTNDLFLLGEALERSPDVVRRELEGHMSGSKDGIDTTSKSVLQRLSAPGLGLLVGLTSIGALLLMPTGGTRDQGGGASSTGRIGTAIVYERDAAMAAETSSGFAEDMNDPRITVST